ncbi:immunoglobulin superfamily member 2 [Pogona vitticeps]
MGYQQVSTVLFFLLLDLYAGERMVSIQKGPLYRAKGYHITIWCNVSGYQGPVQQNFEWSMYKQSAPMTGLQIISTRDHSFPYAVYASRVKVRDIYIERIRGDSILLHLTDLKDEDTGEYECYTPSTDDSYLGSYNAKTSLFAIPDTLSVTVKTQALHRDQGESLELICEVSTATDQHTHVSVAWYLLQDKGSGKAQKILSLSRDFVLLPGSSYAQRFSSGDVRLDKTGDKEYKLSIVNLQPADQGEMYCEAMEWIQDPDETWKDIAWKQSNRTSLTIRSLDKSFFVNISVTERFLLEGDVLEINCTVEAQQTQHRWFQVDWYNRGGTMVTLDPYGSLSFQKEYEERFRIGNLQVKKQSNGKYILKMRQMEVKDHGRYSCVISEMETTPTGSFTITKEVSSLAININVKPRESSLQLFVSVNKEEIMEGDALVLHCNGSVTENSLSVKWWLIQKAGESPVHIASMDQDGQLKIGASYVERNARGEVRAEKMEPSIFTLTIYHTSSSNDTGLYRCEVTERSKGRSWKYTQEISAKVVPLGLNLTAVLSSRIPNVKFDEDFELFCKVSANDNINKLQTSITWWFKPTSGLGNYQQFVKITARGTIEWGMAHLHFQKKTKITKSSSTSHLFIHSATWRDAGMYKCEIEIWRSSAPGRDSATVEAAAVIPSNAVEINVSKPKSKLEVRTDAKLLEISNKEDATIDCKISALTKGNSQLSVTWYFLPLSAVNSAPLIILKTNYSNILEYGEAFSLPNQKSRFHSAKVSSHLYRLLILSPDYDIQGQYYCVVDEWMWSMDGSWYKLGKTESGKTMLYFKPSENKLHIEKMNHSIIATENEDVTLKCIMQSSVQATSRFSITWFKVSEHTESLVKMKGNGVIEYGGNKKLLRRLHLHHPSVGDFRLTLQNVEMLDAGLFYCQVEEWQAANCSASQVHYASSQSGFSSLVVLPSAPSNSTQICSSQSLYHFILFYPPVLFLILVVIFLVLHFKAKFISRGKMNVEKKTAPDEELRALAPADLKPTGKSSAGAIGEETIHLKNKEMD